MTTRALTAATFEQTVREGIRNLDMDAVRADVAQAQTTRAS